MPKPIQLRPKKPSRAASASHTAPAPVEATVMFAPGGRSGFDGANFSTRRGYIYFPTLETRRELDTYSRLELIRRARWLKRNTGFTRRCINGIANMVGSLSPRALSQDRAWNLAAEKLWRQRAGNAETFDLSGRFNVDSYQPLVTRSRLTDGDILSVFTEKYRGAAVMTYEAHQVAPGARANDLASVASGYGWSDGVQTGPQSQPLAYSVVSNPLTGETVDIPAASSVLHADRDCFGWRRGVTALAHGVNNLLDLTEIQSDLKLGIKAANRIGYYEYTALGGVAPTVPGAGDAIRQNLQLATAPKGGDVLLEDTFRGGKIPKLDPGKELRQLLDQRPHPNSMGFIEHLNRDIAAGLEMSSDVLWNIAKLGGASVRYVLADAQTTIERHQQLLVDQFLTRYWIYFCAKEMQAGRLPRCEDPAWFTVGWLPKAKLTVDIARDGKLSIDLHRAGMLTIKRWYGMQGLDDETEDREHVEASARRLVLCQDIEARYQAEGKNIRIDPERVFPTAIPGAAPLQTDPNTPDGTATDPADPAFSAPESFARIEGRLDELAYHFGAAA
jgi:capsid protein